jgi:hypothetical protein
MGVNGQRHAPAALYRRGKDPRYPLNKRLGGLQSWSGHSQYGANVLKLWGAPPWGGSFWSRGGGRVVCMRDVSSLNEICAKDEIGRQLAWNVILTT